MTRPHRRLEVLRVIVAPTQDDQILDPPDDLDSCLGARTEVTGTQERAVVVVGEARPEGGRRLLWAVPVTDSHVVAAYPDLADLTGGAAQSRLRMDNGDLQP